MKRFLFLLISVFFFAGCARTTIQTKSPKEFSLADIASMTSAERDTEIAKIFARIGVQFPENWNAMTKQERGRFILKYGLGVQENGK